MNFVKNLQSRETVGERLALSQNSFLLGDLQCSNKDMGLFPDLIPRSPLYACKFCPLPGKEHWLAAVNEDGRLQLLDTIKSALFGTGDVFLAHTNCIFDLSWMPGEEKLVTGSGDRSAVLWDMSRSPFTGIRCFSCHTRSIKCVNFASRDVFASGARDNTIFIWDVREFRTNPQNSIRNAHCPSNGEGRKKLNGMGRSCSITDLVFWDDQRLISCGANGGDILVWDLRKHYSIYKRDPLPLSRLKPHVYDGTSGFTTLALDPSKACLYASCTDHHIYRFNLASPSSLPDAAFYGHVASSFYVKMCLSPCGNYILSGSSDNNAYIWSVKRPGKPMVQLSGHEEEVSCVAWCPIEPPKIVTCGDDLHQLKWELHHRNNPTNMAGKACLLDQTSTEHLNCPCPMLCDPHKRHSHTKYKVTVQPSTPNSSFPLSPTTNLPNLASENSTPKWSKSDARRYSRLRPTDWLTKLGRQRKAASWKISLHKTTTSLSPTAPYSRSGRRSSSMAASEAAASTNGSMLHFLSKK